MSGHKSERDRIRQQQKKVWKNSISGFSDIALSRSNQHHTYRLEATKWNGYRNTLWSKQTSKDDGGKGPSP